MQAVILAGGLGTRLLPLTKEIPKPMAMVAGQPYLQHQLRLLRDQSITELLMLTGYLGWQIEEYFGDGSRFGVSIVYSREETPLGTGGALREAQTLLHDTFLVIYGDSYLPIDYRMVIRRLESREQTGLVVVYDNLMGDTSVKNNIALGDDGLVHRYNKDVQDDALRYVEAGVLAFRRRVMEYMPQSGVVSLERDIYPALIAQRQLGSYITQQRFYDIGTPERLKAIEILLQQ